MQKQKKKAITEANETEKLEDEILNAKTKFANAKLEITLRYPFFAPLLHKLKPIFSPDFPTLGVNGDSIMIGTKFFNSLSDEEAIFVLLHELAHLIFMEDILMNSKLIDEKALYNFISDAIVNEYLKPIANPGKLGGVMVTPERLGLSEKDVSDKTSLELYAELSKKLEELRELAKQLQKQLEENKKKSSILPSSVSKQNKQTGDKQTGDILKEIMKEIEQNFPPNKKTKNQVNQPETTEKVFNLQNEQTPGSLSNKNSLDSLSEESKKLLKELLKRVIKKAKSIHGDVSIRDLAEAMGYDIRGTFPNLEDLENMLEKRTGIQFVNEKIVRKMLVATEVVFKEEENQEIIEKLQKSTGMTREQLKDKIEDIIASLAKGQSNANSPQTSSPYGGGEKGEEANKGRSGGGGEDSSLLPTTERNSNTSSGSSLPTTERNSNTSSGSSLSNGEASKSPMSLPEEPQTLSKEINDVFKEIDKAFETKANQEMIERLQKKLGVTKEQLKEMIKEAMKDTLLNKKFGELPEEKQNEIKEKIKRAFAEGATLERLSGHGHGQGNIEPFEKLLDHLFKKKRDWKVVLRDAIAKVRMSYTWNKINPKLYSLSYRGASIGNLPTAVRSPEVSNIHIFVDASGSIDTKLYESFIDEIYSILKSFDQLQNSSLYYFDDGLLNEKGESITSWNEKIEKMLRERAGGGGTDLNKALEAIENKSRYLADKIAVVFTDGEFDKIEPSYINKYKQVIFVLPKEGGMTDAIPKDNPKVKVIWIE